MRRGYGNLTIYEHALKPYPKPSSHIVKISNTSERRNVLKAGKEDSITI